VKNIQSFNTSHPNLYKGLTTRDHQKCLASYGGDVVLFVDNLILGHFHIIFCLPMLTIRYLINPRINDETRNASLMDTLGPNLIDRYVTHPIHNLSFSTWIGQTRLFGPFSDAEVKEL
jgi:hypothetical protein